MTITNDEMITKIKRKSGASLEKCRSAPGVETIKIYNNIIVIILIVFKRVSGKIDKKSVGLISF